MQLTANICSTRILYNSSSGKLTRFSQEVSLATLVFKYFMVSILRLSYMLRAELCLLIFYLEGITRKPEHTGQCTVWDWSSTTPGPHSLVLVCRAYIRAAKISATAALQHWLMRTDSSLHDSLLTLSSCSIFYNMSH